MQSLLVILVVFLAIFTQTASGFGLALVAMPLLVQLVGFQVAMPLVALIAVTAEVVLLIRYRSALNLAVVWRLVVASIAGIPFGLLIPRYLDERIALTALGVVVVSYAVYGLLDFRLPELRHSAWAVGLGLLSGVLGGAYNISGPPVVIYGHCQRWSAAEFKGNLQGFFVVSTGLVVLGHALSGNLTPTVWQNYLLGLVGVGLGVGVGLRLDRYIDPATFRKLVLVLLVALGLRLIL